MANHPNRSQSARQQVQGLGYYIREGSYHGTTRWYFGYKSGNGFRPLGAGYRTQREAWEAALEHGRQFIALVLLGHRQRRQRMRRLERSQQKPST